MKQLFSRFLFAVILLTGLGACKKETNGIRIRFINTSGTDIQQAMADNTLLGNIKNDASTGYILFEKFGMDTGFPDCRFTGIQSGVQRECTSRFYWCGTEKSALKEGKYDIEITIREINNVPYFHLQFR
jgi:hypothetical protein